MLRDHEHLRSSHVAAADRGLVSAGAIGRGGRHAADQPSGITGSILTTRYPALTVRAGETTTIDVSVRNFNCRRSSWRSRCRRWRNGWKATILGGGQPVEAVDRRARHRRTAAAAARAAAGHRPGRLPLHSSRPRARGSDLKLPITRDDRRGAAGQAQADHQLPRAARHRDDLVQVSRSRSTNDSGRDATINFSADAPKNFQVNFTEAYGSQQITSIPIEAGKTKDVEASLTIPRDTPAGDYKLALHAKTEAASADLAGQPHDPRPGAAGAVRRRRPPQRRGLCRAGAAS